ncbi:MAG: hypothetical protein KAR05_01020 [Candidatus Omnitrophica bacterium]|nr:hypothetical protein [Candidatus Omnitrophota bacterium]
MLKISKCSFFYAAFFLMTACSLAYGLLIAQTMTSFVGHMVKCYSVTLGVFFFSQGMARLWFKKIIRAAGEAEVSWKDEIGASLFYLSGVGGLFAAYVHLTLQWMRDSYWPGLMMFYAVYFFIIWLAGHVTGMQLLRIQNVLNAEADKKGWAEKKVIVQSFGYLAAGCVFAGVLYPLFNVITSAFIVALFHLLALALIYAQAESEENPAPLITAGFVIIFLVCLGGIICRQQVSQFFLKKYYYYPYAPQIALRFLGSMKGLEDVERYKEGRHAVDIVKKPVEEMTPSSYLMEAYSRKFFSEPDFPQDYRFYINNDFRLSTNYEDIYYEYFAHIPIILNQSAPENALIIGGGDGCLLRELLKYSAVKQIVLLAPQGVLLDLAKDHAVLKQVNKGALQDPRVKVVRQDAFRYMIKEGSLFDAVYFDPPSPTEYGSSRGYSVELFQLAARKLKKGGFAVLRAPRTNFFMRDSLGEIRLAQNNDWLIYYHTLKAAGFKTILGYMSNLEGNNKKASSSLLRAFQQHQGALSMNLSDKAQGRINSRILNVIQKHVILLREGFIFLKREDGEIRLKYEDQKIPLYVLNSPRFYAAFRVPYIYPSALDRSRVNSIMRPTLPSKETEWVKLPY